MKDDIQINAEAIKLRRHFGEDASSPLDIFRLICSTKDLTLTFFPMSDRISGISIKADDLMIMGINSRLTEGRQRFTAAHELYHLFFDDDFSTRICFKDIPARNTKEQEADKFASFFLAPYEALSSFIETSLEKMPGSLTLEDVVRIEQHFGMSRHATLVRLQREGYLSPKQAESMKTNVISSARKLGFDISLYLPTPEHKQYSTYGRYVRLAELLKEKELISTGKYEELLLDGFRGDIVYGTSPLEERYD